MKKLIKWLVYLYILTMFIGVIFCLREIHQLQNEVTDLKLTIANMQLQYDFDHNQIEEAK